MVAATVMFVVVPDTGTFIEGSDCELIRSGNSAVATLMATGELIA